MIFDRFFKAKHLQSDPEVRLQAITNLSLDKPSDKQALHELAFNDSNANVSLSALDKLNSFPLWLKASETAENPRIKKLAHEKVLKELTSPKSDLINEDEFDAFVAESNNTGLLEQMLFSNERLQNNDPLALSVLLKVNKQNTNRLYFKDYANQAQQQVIVKRTDDVNELSKLAKISEIDVVLKDINEKIERLRELAALPQQLKQDATLVISKLLALKDSSNYEDIFDSKQKLCQEFELYKINFSVLDEETALLLAEKYLRVNESVEKRLAALKEDWQIANELKQTTNDLAQIEARFNEVKQQIDAILASIDDPSLLAQSKILGNALADIGLDAEDATSRPQTVAHKRMIKSILSNLATYNGFLQQLPFAREIHEQAKALLAELNALPDDLSIENLSDTLKKLKTEWKKLVEQSSLPLPKALLSDWRDGLKKHQSRVSLVNDELKQKEKKTLGKLKTIQRMINQGSFKPALATFKYAQEMYDSLPERSQKGLAKLYTELNEKVIELQELQAFIAGPRKPALLELVGTLASETEVKEISDRAQKVKSYRAEWNELGKLGTPEDDALNKQFDELIEKAFQPCREHYAEQDKVRADNALIAKTFIDELIALSSHENTASLGRAVSRVNKKWRALGNLEQGERRKLQKAYQAALKPIQVRLDEFYSDNLQRKQVLLKKAEQLASVEDIASAAELAKQYQQQWKDIGFSGKKTDEDLWASFRQANDAVFAKITEKRDAEAVELSNIRDRFNALASQITEQLNQASEMKDLAELNDKTDELRQISQELPSRQANQEQQKLEALIKQHKNKQAEFEKSKLDSQWLALFDALAKWEDTSLPETIDQLANKYQQLIKTAMKSPSGLNRRELTIKAEILADASSNKADEAERKKIQLQLMATKLEGGNVPTLLDVLADWIACGPLIKTDQALLKRLKKTITV